MIIVRVTENPFWSEKLAYEIYDQGSYWVELSKLSWWQFFRHRKVAKTVDVWFLSEADHRKLERRLRFFCPEARLHILEKP